MRTIVEMVVHTLRWWEIRSRMPVRHRYSIRVRRCQRTRQKQEHIIITRRIHGRNRQCRASRRRALACQLVERRSVMVKLLAMRFSI